MEVEEAVAEACGSGGGRREEVEGGEEVEEEEEDEKDVTWFVRSMLAVVSYPVFFKVMSDAAAEARQSCSRECKRAGK